MRTKQIGALLLVISCLLADISATAQKLPGYGVRTCGQFGDDYRSDVTVEAIYYSWAQGFLSAKKMQCELTVIKQRCAEILTPTYGAAEQMAFLRGYCADNPLRQYLEAIGALNDQIQLRQGLPTSADNIKKFQDWMRDNSKTSN